MLISQGSYDNVRGERIRGIALISSRLQIARYIDGRAGINEHGPRNMPVWGKRFYSEGQGSERQVKD